MATYERVVQPIIAEFFRRRNGRFFNQRLSEIRAETDEKHLRRVEAGKKGGRQLKSPENNNFGLSNAKAMLKQPEPEPEPEPDKEESSKKEEGSKSRAKRLSATWRLPQEWGKWALDQGMAEARVRTEADKFRDYWMAKAGAGGLKRDWLATWRNWIRTAMERGQHEKPSQQAARFKAFLAGATITPPMDSGSHSDTSQPLLARR